MPLGEACTLADHAWVSLSASITIVKSLKLCESAITEGSINPLAPDGHLKPVRHLEAPQATARRRPLRTTCSKTARDASVRSSSKYQARVDRAVEDEAQRPTFVDQILDLQPAERHALRCISMMSAAACRAFSRSRIAGIRHQPGNPLAAPRNDYLFALSRTRSRRAPNVFFASKAPISRIGLLLQQAKLDKLALAMAPRQSR